MRKCILLVTTFLVFFMSLFVGTTASFAGGAWNGTAAKPHSAMMTSDDSCTWLEYIAIWYEIEWCVQHLGPNPGCFVYTC